MNKQKKTKLMAALSLLLTCAPCNFTNAMETNKKKKQEELTTEIKTEIITSDDDSKEYDDKPEEEEKTSSKPEMNEDEDEDEDEKNTYKTTSKPKKNDTHLKLMKKSIEYDDNLNHGYWKYSMMSNIMQKQRKKQKLILGIGVPVGAAALGIVGFGIYKGIKKMKKDGKPQPTKNVENKGKKLVSPNVKSN